MGTIKHKSILEIRNDLLKAFLDLENIYISNTIYPVKKIAYLEIETCEYILNAMKSLEYHYRDDIPEMRVKKKWTSEMKIVHKLLKKYGELKDPENQHSKIILKEEFDDSGYLAHRSFIEDAKSNREILKRKI